jgi:hypothetical protein
MTNDEYVAGSFIRHSSFLPLVKRLFCFHRRPSENSVQGGEILDISGKEAQRRLLRRSLCLCCAGVADRKRSRA